MKSSLLVILVICLLSCNYKKSEENNLVDNRLNDTIFYGKTESGLDLKTIVYKSKQIDSFKLRVRYIDDVFTDSMYISENGFIKGKSFSNIGDGIRRVSEYLNINGENYLNQFWTIEGKDTLGYGNNYHIRVNRFPEEEGELQIEILLTESKNKIFSKLYFIYPKGGDFSKLNSDFSNYRDIQFDTIYNLITYNKTNNNTYDEYWSKRSVIFNMNFNEKKDNYLRGILIERKDTSYTDINDNKIIHLERYLYINKDLHKIK
jgi:hypothetical protein